MELSTITEDDVKFFSLHGLTIKGKVVNVYDGDTIHIVIPLHDTYHKFKARIIGIDTPEMKLPITCEDKENKKKCAIIARNTLVSLITNCTIDVNYLYDKKQLSTLLKTNTLVVDINFYEFDKYGRCLIDINKASEQMITLGMANAYDGGTKKVEFDSYHATK